jgi:hypothetical protein
MAFHFSYVLCPRSRGSDKLKNWDLWGPFFMCCILGVFINGNYAFKVDATQFLVLFGVVFGGAIVVTFNTRILGGKISLFQSVSILGYCIFPLFFAMVILKILSLVGYNHILIKIFAMLTGALWGVLGKSIFIKLLLSLLQVTSMTLKNQLLSILFYSFICL